MASSGITAAAEVDEAAIKLKSGDCEGFRLMVDDPAKPKEVVLEKGSFIPSGSRDVLTKMKSGFGKNARWGVCKIPFKPKNGTKSDKYYILAYASDEANVKEKMVHASTRAYIKTRLATLNATEVQLSSYDECNINMLHNKCPGNFKKEELEWADGRRLKGKIGCYKSDHSSCSGSSSDSSSSSDSDGGKRRKHRRHRKPEGKCQ